MQMAVEIVLRALLKLLAVFVEGIQVNRNWGICMVEILLRLPVNKFKRILFVRRIDTQSQELLE